MAIQKIINFNVWLVLAILFFVCTTALSNAACQARLDYDTAVVHFKAGKLNLSLECLEQLTQNPDCPELVSICSVNMVGQISRLRGDYNRALENFNQLEKMLKNNIGKDKFLEKIYTSACISIAEINELLGKDDKAIANYTKCVNTHTGNIYEKIARIYLRQNNYDGYFNTINKLEQKYPQYLRLPIIKLESICVRHLRQAENSDDFLNDSFQAPADLIRYINKTTSVNFEKQFVEEVQQLCIKYESNKNAVLQKYHFACILDALGKYDNAKKLFNDITNENNDGNLNYKLKSYAAIQLAVLLGENKEYSKAINTIAEFSGCKDKHIQAVSKALADSFQLLKRKDTDE